jgi:hypothetical protein
VSTVASQNYPLHVELEDGKQYDVTGDQRDVARWELQSFGGPVTEARLKWNTFARFIAWSASTRTGATDMTWDAFDKAAVEVNEQVEGYRDDAEDPGQEAASAKPSLSLPSP